jgi:hypothetical protein
MPSVRVPDPAVSRRSPGGRPPSDVESESTKNDAFSRREQGKDESASSRWIIVQMSREPYSDLGSLRWDARTDWVRWLDSFFRT